MKIPKYSCGSDDIMWCWDKCDNHKCFRNPVNQIHVEIPHSYSCLKGTKFCPSYLEEKKNENIRKN